jgi:hypothetical protein
METAKKWHIASLVIIICLTVALIACLFWVHSLSGRLATLEFDHRLLSDNVGRLNRTQNMLESELDELIREATSLTEELEYTVVGAGTQPNTAAYQLTLIPKELAEDTTVKISVGNNTVRLSRNGDTFSGTVDIPLFEENEEYPVLTVTSAGITKKDVLEEISLWYAYNDWLPYLFQSMNGIGSNEDPEKTDVFLAYAFRLNNFYTNTPVRFTKITMTKTVNGEEGPCQYVTNQFIDYGDYAEFNLPDITVSNTDNVTVVIRAEDSMGYIHELTTHSRYDEESGCVAVGRDETERIYGPDGTLLYRSAFEDLT